MLSYNKRLKNYIHNFFFFFTELIALPELTEDELKELKNIQNNIQNQIKKCLRFTTYHYRPLQ